jgi:hypothetical protein
MFPAIHKTALIFGFAVQVTEFALTVRLVILAHDMAQHSTSAPPHTTKQQEMAEEAYFPIPFVSAVCELLHKVAGANGGRRRGCSHQTLEMHEKWQEGCQQTVGMGM